HLMQQLREGHAGSLTIAAVPSLVQAFVTPALVRFHNDRPDTRIESLVLPTTMVADCVARSEADFGLIYQPVDNPFLDAEVICEAQAVCVLPSSHALAGSASLTLRDLQDVPLVSFREDTAIGWLVRR